MRNYIRLSTLALSSILALSPTIVFSKDFKDGGSFVAQTMSLIECAASLEIDTGEAIDPLIREIYTQTSSFNLWEFPHVDIHTIDDELNAGGDIEINGGYIYAFSNNCDAVDGNASMTINGGVIVAHDAGVPEGGLDNDQNTFAVNGGTFVALGGRNSTSIASATTQNTVSLGNVIEGLLTVRDNAGNIAIAYEMPETVTALLVSSPDFKTGVSYSFYQGGDIGSYSKNLNGFLPRSGLHSNGTEVDTFTITSTVTLLDGGDTGPQPPIR
jgi:hypothetical protein